MNDELKFDYITTEAAAQAYISTSPIFEGILQEVRELSKKKPEATMSASKVKIINRILEDLLLFLNTEPAGKYLETLDDDTLPQMSDAVLTMVQFESALKSFYSRYYKYVGGQYYWITSELLAEWVRDS